MKWIFKNNNVKLHLFIVLLTCFYTLMFTFSEFYDSPFNGIKDFLILAMQWGVIFIATYGLLLILSLNKYLFSLLFPILTLLCSFLTYFRYTLNISLTPMLIDLTLVNDFRTGMELMSISLFIFVFICFLFALFTVYYRWKKIKIEYWYFHLFISVFLISLTNGLVDRFVRPVSERIPYSIYYNFKKYIDERQQIAMERNLFTENSQCYSDSITIVLVLGESLRADHLGLNGYIRNTTPLLSKDTNVVSFPNIYTEPCYTHLSVPHILTRADSISPQLAFEEPSFISLLKQADFRTSWLANQESVVNYVYFMKECDTLIYANSGKSMYVFDQWLDADLFPFYNDVLREKALRNFILLHTIGSHWWYDSHYPEEYKKYLPTVNSRVVSSCTQEEIINSYDNSILYTDYILCELIKKLESKKAILFFLSDHGESLGEDGYYIHGTDHPTLHNPACFVWTSSSFQLSYPEKVNKLKENRLKRYRTDFMFHSILDAADLESSYRNNFFSIFK